MDPTLAWMLGKAAWMAGWLAFSLVAGLAVLASVGRADGGGGLAPPNGEATLFLAAAAGIGLQFPILVALALAGLLTPWAVLLAAAVVLAWAIATLWRSAATRPVFSAPGGGPLELRWWLGLLPLALMLLPWVFRPLQPPVNHDDMSYHLPYARAYLEHAGLVVDSTLRYPLHSHNYNLLYAVALMPGGTELARWMHGASGYLALLGAWAMARHAFGWTAAVAAVALVLLNGAFTESLGNAYVDLGVTLFFTAAAFAFWLWREQGRPAWLWLSAAFVGTAAGTKYYALVLGLLLGLAVWLSARRWRPAWQFALVAALFGGFWYLRSWWISGNPVHPFASGIFGHYLWSPQDLGEQWGELASHGVDRTPGAFLRLPKELLTDPWQFHGPMLWFGWLLAAFWASLLTLRWWPAALRWLSATALAALVFWFATSQVGRYLLPVTPLMAVAASALVGLPVSALARRLPRVAGAKGARVLTALGGLVAVALVGWWAWHAGVREFRRLPLTEPARQAWLMENRKGYELYRTARADPRIGAGPLLQFRLEGERWFFDGRLLGDWNGPWRYAQFTEPDEEAWKRLVPPGQLWSRLREEGIRGVVFGVDGKPWFFPGDLDAWAPWFETVLSNRHGVLLVPRAAPRPDDPPALDGDAPGD